MIAGAAAAWNAVPAAQRRMIVLLFAAIALANVAQPYPELAALQHVPVILLLGAAPWLLLRWPLSTPAVACIWLFLMLHTLGARYIYSYVPYDDWARMLTGQPISARLGLQRNGFDRVVHFAFGALMTLPVAQVVRRSGALSRGWSLAFAFAAIGLGSAGYEIFEWLLTIIAAGETADYYNGQQGDVWDPQKDMAAAQIGSVVALGILLLRPRGQRHIGGTSQAGE